MAKKQVHVFEKKRTAINFRKRALKNGQKVSRITKINERSGGRTYRYRLVIS